MTGIRLIGGCETSEALNTLARHQMICRLLKDIRFDMEVCRIEGWDETEYIRMLKSELDRMVVS